MVAARGTEFITRVAAVMRRKRPVPTGSIAGLEKSLQSGAMPTYWAPSPKSTTRTVSARINVSSTSELFFT